VYVGSNANSLSGATQVGTYTFSTFHSAGGVVQHAVVFTVPNRSSGTYWVHAFVDSADVVKNESSESDNYSYSLGHSVQLGINVKRSNLQTRTKLSIPNVTVNEGASFTVSVPVWNNDNDATRDKVGGNSVRFDVWVYVSSFSNSIAGGSVVGKATYSTGLNAGGIATVQVPVQLPGGVVGSRYLHAVLNPIVGSSRKVGNERDVSNNTSHYYGHSTIVYISQGRSDLEFTQKLKASTTTLAAGGTLSITASAKNIGNATTRDRAGGSPQVVTISFTLNQNPFSAIGGTGLGTVQSSGAINPGQAVTLTRTLTIPKVAAGNYYLHGTLLKAGNEGPTFNNETATAGFSLPVKIIAAKLSDLTITNQLGTSNPLPYAGQSVSVTVPVRNTGKEQTRRSASGSATGFRIAVYINNSGTSLTGATRIGTYTVSGSLASNASQLVTVSATIPSSWQAGKAWLHAVVDDQNVVGNDQNRNNNNSVQTNTALGINVTAANQTKRADVAFAALLWSSSANPYPGQSLSIQVQPKNIGNDTTRKTVGGTSTTFGISLYLSKNANNITGATRIGLATTSTSIGAGGTLLVSINATVPATTTPGSYYLHAVLDSNRDIGNESITSNNASWSSNHSIRINVVKDSKRADLTFATGDKVAINTPTPYTGQQIVVYSVLENKGQDAPRLTVGGTQTGVEYSVYLGKNENNLTGAVRIGGGALRGLSAGAKSSLSIPATIPSSFATGSAWIHVVVDPTRKVGNEGNFVNNATYNLKTSLKVSISGSNKRSNLRQTTKMSVSGVVYAGAPSTYSFRIENNGNEQTLASIGGGSTGFKVRVYLAPNATSTQGATLWREVSTAALGASSSREIKFTLRTPAATKPGSYWLHVVLDEPGDVGNESNLKDNFNAALSLQISIGAIDDKDKDGVKSDKDCDDNDKHNYPGNKEICDGQDNNCDGKVDDTSNLCASGSKCLSGKCVSDCQPTCGSGFVCRNFQCVPNDCYALGCKTGEICLNNKCVTNPCQGVSCASGEYCRAGKCIKTCTGVSCKAGEMCVDGGCVKDPCYTTTCKSGEVCVKGSCQTDRCVGRVCGAARICDPATGKCIDDPCAAITCPNATDYCKNGVCSNNPCQVTCKQGQRCWNGYCVADTCYNFGCPSGQTCSGGQCVQNPCSGVSCNSGEYCLNGKCRKSCSGVTCSNGEICQYGTCVKDPCAGVTCSSGEVCLAGKCQKDLCASVYCGTGQICDKATGKCTTDPCLPINCPSGQVCRNGSCFESPCKPACQQDQVCVNKQCVKNDCYTRGCPSGQICTKGLCIQDPCDNVSCNSGEYCYKGKCVKTCATVTCNTGERCVLGKCEKDPCTGVSCKTGEVCWRGVCITSKCAGVLCPLGKTCNPATGLCEDSSCAHVTCPSRDQYCQNGTCYAYKCNTTCQSGYICYKGQCREDNCYTYGCKAGEVCRQGSCSSDSCKGKTCGSDEFCRGGHCIKSCAKVTCQSDEKCEDGSCVADPCTKVVCKKGEYCDENGSCQTDRCTKVVCGAGRVCEKSTGKCIDDPCAGVTCPGSGQECRNGQCVQSSCNPSCKAGEVCQGGKCVANDCYVRGCPSGQRCRQGFCEEDPCDNKTCAADEFCRDGKCVASCAGVTCAADEFCRDGKCTADPCAGKSCSSGEVCVNGSCVADKCQSVTCGTGRICDPTNGKCVDNPCNNITCPSGEVCKEGNCFKDPNTGEPNEPTEPSENNGENPDVNDGEVVSDADAGDGGDEPNDGDEPKKEDKTDGENKDDKTQDDVDNKDKNSGGKNDGAGVDVPEVPAEGCQCSAAGAPSASFLFFVLFFLGLGSLRRRRR
jgi:MYXO-CTERM domain-containing protein